MTLSTNYRKLSTKVFASYELGINYDEAGIGTWMAVCNRCSLVADPKISQPGDIMSDSVRRQLDNHVCDPSKFVARGT